MPEGGGDGERGAETEEEGTGLWPGKYCALLAAEISTRSRFTRDYIATMHRRTKYCIFMAFELEEKEQIFFENKNISVKIT